MNEYVSHTFPINRYVVYYFYLISNKNYESTIVFTFFIIIIYVLDRFHNQMSMEYNFGMLRSLCFGKRTKVVRNERYDSARGLKTRETNRGVLGLRFTSVFGYSRCQCDKRK